MVSRRAAFKQADATRALRAAVAAGLKPISFRIDPSGAIVVNMGDGAVRSSNSFDEIQGS